MERCKIGGKQLTEPPARGGEDIPEGFFPLKRASLEEFAHRMLTLLSLWFRFLLGNLLRELGGVFLPLLDLIFQVFQLPRARRAPCFPAERSLLGPSFPSDARSGT